MCFFSGLKLKVEKFRETLCDEFCELCDSKCCNRLNPRVGRSPLFSDLPVYNKKKLPLNEKVYIVKSGLTDIYLKGVCPYFDESGRCSVHSSPDRPSDCRNYPVSLYYTFPLLFPILRIEKSCKMFDNGANCRKVYSFATKNHLDVIFV